MPFTSNCAAQTPPPARAKPAPYEFGAISFTTHPEGVLQSVPNLASPPVSPVWNVGTD